ncbi:Two component transcriptional regulator, winged helix family [Pseudomonas savastanoi pv. fraxini]|nr:Two component transcriptional regulator, winged helix family [Pseudomonas savastanoi pv. savastanoi]KUG41349.1 Two component transcriptional regulator, winged helix family [Pseudomonas savastanoi pv. fraxini]RMR79344.1 Two component transcriptional regulator, winged helix family [Pseudomonas savastanoi pv. fraxini]
MLAQPFGLQVRRRVEHFLHARTAFRAFVTDDDDVASLHFVSKNPAYCAVLAFEDFGVAFEDVNRLVDTGSFHYAAIQRDVAVQHGQAAFLRIGVLYAADAAVFAVVIQAFPTGRLAERGLRRDACRARLEEGVHGFVVSLGDVPFGDAFGQGLAVHGRQVGVQQAATGQLAKDAEDPARAVHVFHVVLLDVRRDLAQLRHLARQTVDVAQVEIDLGFLSGGQQVQDGVGRAAHGDVQRHGVFERLEVGDVARQHRIVVFLVVLTAQVNDGAASLQEQLLAVAVGGECGTVARQCKTQCFGQAVHRVGGEHAGTRPAGRTGAALVLGDFFVTGGRVSSDDHRIDQIQAVAGQFGLARFHWPAGDEDHRNVQAQRRHQHARGDLVAVGNAHDGVGAMRIDHVLDGVGNDLAARQRIEHTVVAHGDTVIDRNGVEFLGHATGALDFTRDQLAHVLEVDVAGYELGEGVGDGDDRFLEVFVLHARGAPQGTGAGHVAAVGGRFRAVIRH